MRPLVETVIEDRRWDGIGLGQIAERGARAALAGVGLMPDGFSVALLACDDARIAALNGTFRGKGSATNVLSWPAEERGAGAEGARPDLPEPGGAGMPRELGDIAIAWETCAREAEAAGKPLSDHAMHLVVHATLHLLGYDHIREGDAALMEGLETRILAGMGLPDPYSEPDS
ncbi:rRNA maturation RNase YbeY [Solirhodobacter olei]|uniref:rRNA maturation RNase YbeY n=1 Tax=Solirhodobacter olei TaxID=2493082 RepID=UPI000FDC472A|nr:rRNA maturation RNase YbeY [Solirhodobacter olei]